VAINLLPEAAGHGQARRAAASLQRCLEVLAEKRLGELYDAWDRFRRAKPFWT
jgi:hypothetical protein